MATLLDGVNEVLKKATVIQGDSGVLTTITDGARQVYIDNAIQAWNEAVADVYDMSDEPMPNELAEGTITLVTNDRDYALASAMNYLRFPLQNETDGTYITEYPGGYLQMVQDQPVPGNFTGVPQMGAIRPTDGELYLDRIPTSTENGDVYKYRYDKDLELTLAADTFPFKDIVFRAMVPAVYQLRARIQKNSFDEGLYKHNMGIAIRALTQKQQSDSWLPKRTFINNSDPFNA